MSYKQFVKQNDAVVAPIEQKKRDPGIITHKHHLGEIEKIISDQERRLRMLGEKNAQSTRALAQIKSILERALKDKTKLNDAVYEVINIARSLTPYSANYGVSHTIDPPLSDAEKTL